MKMPKPTSTSTSTSTLTLFKPVTFKPTKFGPTALLQLSGLGLAIIGSASLAFAIVPTSQTATVTNSNDYGQGSLRAALASGARKILVLSEEDIVIDSPLNYAAHRSLALYGNGQTIKATGDFTLLTISEGANLSVTGLNFEGVGGFDINHQSVDPRSAGKGIFVDVREGQRGTVRLRLEDVTVSNVANHGVHVSDCDLADACGAGATGLGGGSAASIAVSFTNVAIINVGNGKFDADGLRVDERDKGGITFEAINSTFTGVGADGVELDEGQDGRVEATVVGSRFNNNGGYCDPELLESELVDFLGAFDDEDEFELEERVAPADLPGKVQGSSDDGCFEYEVDFYDSGFVEAYEYSIDVDDGFDIDEEGNGSLRVQILNSEIKHNLDEGVDFDEADRGSIELVIVDTLASDNTDDGYKFSEEGNGAIDALVLRSSARNNGGKGFVFEEEDNGSLDVQLERVTTGNNDDGDDTGVEVVQADRGTGVMSVIGSAIEDGIDADGVTLTH